MTYLKLLANSPSRRHLTTQMKLADATTLCGCTLTQVSGWKRIDHLEGDECPKCADLSFWSSKPAVGRWASPSGSQPVTVR